MDFFEYRDGELFAEDVPVTTIVEAVGSPCYIYSRATFERHYNAYVSACADHRRYSDARMSL